MSIYTKKGDKGTTGLFASTKKTWTIPKDSTRIQVLGSIDEINSFLGLAAAFSPSPTLKELLSDVQKELFKIGSVLAGAPLRITIKSTTKLEKIIDMLEKDLPPLKNFILPGGNQVGAILHATRATTRRAERHLTTLAREEYVPGSVQKYINRLSDFLFVLARKVNIDTGTPEVVWKTK